MFAMTYRAIFAGDFGRFGRGFGFFIYRWCFGEIAPAGQIGGGIG